MNSLALCLALLVGIDALPPPPLPKVDWSRQSVFIIGSHANVHGAVVYAFPGKVKSGVFHGSMFTPVRMNQRATDGYFVGVAKGEEQLSPSSFEWPAGGAPYYVVGQFYFCKDSPAPVFTAQPGKIIYVSDLYTKVGPGKEFRYAFKQDAEAARQWVASHYPQDLDRFLVAPEAQMPQSGKCKNDK